MDISPGTSNGGGGAAAEAEAWREQTRPSAMAPAGRCSKRVLGDLLALNIEMVGQLQLERLSDAGTNSFLTRMIDQHEKAAALLRTELARLKTAGSVARR